jgi:hypothetical protein
MVMVMVMSGHNLTTSGLSTSPSPDRYPKAPIRDETPQNEPLQTHNSGALGRVTPPIGGKGGEVDGLGDPL